MSYLMPFFNSSRHNIKFFGHTWDQNHWKRPGHVIEWQPLREEQLDANKLLRELTAEAGIKFEALRVDKQEESKQFRTRQNADYMTSWAGMFKSSAMAMHMKKTYEIEHNMRFDVVIKTRFDVAYHPKDHIDHHLTKEIEPDGIYVCTSNFLTEFRMPLINDIAYYGSSHAMDILDSFWFYYVNGRFNEMVNYSIFNRAYDLVGPGVLLYKWATLKNLKMITTQGYLNPIPIREHVAHAMYPNGFDEITKAYAGA